MAAITIVALGDSITARTPGLTSQIEAPANGSGSVESQGAYWLWQAHLDWRVMNRGVNDLYQGRTADLVERELQLMYEAARAAGIRVVAGSIMRSNTATPGQNARLHGVNAWIASARRAILPSTSATRARRWRLRDCRTA